MNNNQRRIIIQNTITGEIVTLPFTQAYKYAHTSPDKLNDALHNGLVINEFMVSEDAKIDKAMTKDIYESLANWDAVCRKFKNVEWVQEPGQGKQLYI